MFSQKPPNIVTGAHGTGSPNESTDQIGKNWSKNVRKLCFFSLSGQLLDIFRTFFRHFSDILSTFFGHFVDIPCFWAVQRFARRNPNQNSPTSFRRSARRRFVWSAQPCMQRYCSFTSFLSLVGCSAGFQI